MREGDTPNRSQSFAKQNEQATVRIMGNIGRTAQGDRVEKELVETPLKLGSLLEQIQKKYGLELRRDSTLVMINGVEARALSDLETVVESGDEVVLVPMFHGG